MIDGIPIATLTAPTLVGIIVILILIGRLVPWTVLKKAEKEAEKWQKAYEAEREARKLLAGQNAELLEIARTTHDILDAMFQTPSIGKHRGSSGGPHVVPMAR